MAATASAPPGALQAAISQPPLRIGLGLLAFVFYLWITHSYKVDLGDVAVGLIGIGVLLKGGRLHVPAPLKFLGILLLWSAAGLLITKNATVTGTELIALGKVWIITFFILNLVRTAAELRFAVIAWLGIFALYPIRGALYNQFICQCGERGRIAWNFTFSNPNDLAIYCLIPLGLAAAVAVMERVKFWRLCGLVGVAVVLLSVMLTQSRGAMLGVAGSVAVLFLASKRRGRDLILLGVLAGTAALFAPRGVWERLAGLSNVSMEKGMAGVDQEGSAEHRWAIWQIAFYTIQQKPLMGVGLGMQPVFHREEALRRNYNIYVRGAKDTHSTYLRITAETGFPGLIIYMAIWGTLLAKLRGVRKKIRHHRPREAQALLFIEVACYAYLIASLFGTYYMVSFTYLGIAIAWLCASILEREPWYVPPKVQAKEAASLAQATR